MVLDLRLCPAHLAFREAENPSSRRCPRVSGGVDRDGPHVVRAGLSPKRVPLMKLLNERGVSRAAIRVPRPRQEEDRERADQFDIM